MKKDAIRIDYFSDVLCVWAYVAQARVEELETTFGERIDLDSRFIQVFGNTAGKFESQWGARGGAPAYAEHVREILGEFEHVTVHPDAWGRVIPTSSIPPHLFLCSVRLLEGAGELPRRSLATAAWSVRKAFFVKALDVSSTPVLMEIARKLNFDPGKIQALLDSGAAHAALFDDVLRAREHGARISPTMIFNEGRQRLTGNVGYRVIEANVRELLDRPASQHSWC